MAGGMCDRGMCMVKGDMHGEGGMHGRGHVWQVHVWQGACMHQHPPPPADTTRYSQ